MIQRYSRKAMRFGSRKPLQKSGSRSSARLRRAGRDRRDPQGERQGDLDKAGHVTFDVARIDEIGAASPSTTSSPF